MKQLFLFSVMTLSVGCTAVKTAILPTTASQTPAPTHTSTQTAITPPPPSSQPSSQASRTPTQPPLAQTTTPAFSSIKLDRAKNWARQAAEKENGGIEQYRAEGSMFGPIEDAPFQQNPDGTVTFQFRGGPPGQEPFTIETVVTVDPDRRSVVIDYNGPIR